MLSRVATGVALPVAGLPRRRNLQELQVSTRTPSVHGRTVVIEKVLTKTDGAPFTKVAKFCMMKYTLTPTAVKSKIITNPEDHVIAQKPCYRAALL